MKNLLQKIPDFFKSFYFLSSAFFLTWLLFIDSNDIITQVNLTEKHRVLVSQKKFYEDEIIDLENDRAALESNPALLEKLAREKYLMKKENEDVYIIVKDVE